MCTRIDPESNKTELSIQILKHLVNYGEWNTIEIYPLKFLYNSLENIGFKPIKPGHGPEFQGPANQYGWEVEFKRYNSTYVLCGNIYNGGHSFFKRKGEKDQ